MNDIDIIKSTVERCTRFAEERGLLKEPKKEKRMKAVTYVRFSPRPGSKACDSCDKQRKRCQDYANSKGYWRVADFQDAAVSGGDLNRPGLEDMLKYLKKHATDHSRIAVIVDCVDRLARDLLVNLTLRQRIEKAHGVLEFADGTPNDDTPGSKFFVNMMAAMAAFERDRICYRTSRGIKKRQANGEHFGKVPIGYARDPENGTKLIIQLTESQAVAFARDVMRGRRSCGSGSHTSSRELAEMIQERYGNFRGGSWKARTVRKMIAKTHNWEKEEESGD